ncbi:MAG: outer membrane lipoprotein-sorting protein [Rhodocyclales bacterium]|nr:outer membrane lipoprotein-sorting protein [Rhodocyclales bacterium]
MFKRSAMVLLASISLGAAAADDAKVKALLKQADDYRLAIASGRVDTEVRSFKGDTLDKTRLYAVYLKPGRRSLVLFRTASERGQKMLMLGDDYWLMMPASQRPLRITAMQKLLGEASTGDIATMTWSEDYDGSVSGEETIDGQACLKLDLVGQRKGVSYPRIVLYLAKKDRHPVQAELYVASDKLAKLARFRMGEVGGRRQVTVMTLVDHLQKERSTEVHYLSRTDKSLSDDYFNPAFLVRADLPQ